MRIKRLTELGLTVQKIDLQSHDQLMYDGIIQVARVWANWGHERLGSEVFSAFVRRMDEERVHGNWGRVIGPIAERILKMPRHLDADE